MSITTHMVYPQSISNCSNTGMCTHILNGYASLWTDKEKFRVWIIFVSSAFITYVSLDILYFKMSYPIPAIFRNFNIPFLGKVSKKDEEQ